MIDNKIFCTLPFLHYQVKADGKIKPCCRFDSARDNRFEFILGELPDPLVSEPWSELRKHMVEGTPVRGCRKCYDEESVGKSSMRQQFNIRFRGFDNQTPKLRYLEIAFGNYCNLKCRSCGSILSSTWHDDDIALAPYWERYLKPPKIDVPFTWTPEMLAQVEEIKFTGGEPMLHPHFSRLIEMLVDSGRAEKVALNIFTNTSWTPKEKLLKSLSRFFEVRMCLSIDGLGVVNNYMRAPSRWEEVERSADRWLRAEAEYSNFDVRWAPTISLYNILQFPDMLRWWLSKRMETRGYHVRYGFQDKAYPMFIINWLHDPAFMAATLLPDEQKQDVIRKVNAVINEFATSNEAFDAAVYERVAMGTISFLKLKPRGTLADFAAFTADLDRLRSEKFADALPELKAVLGDLDYTGRLP